MFTKILFSLCVGCMQFNDYVVCRVYNMQVKNKTETYEEKDLIDSLIGPKPVMTNHDILGYLPRFE